MEVYALIATTFIVLLFSPFRKLYFKVLPKKNDEVKSKSSHLPFFDFIRGLSIAAVILIHVLYIFEKNFPHIFTPFIFFFNNILRFAIPVFLVTSGILLEKLEIKWNILKKFYTKKILKTFIPFTLLSIAFGIIQQKNLKDIFLSLFYGNGSVPYYFVIILFQCYLLYPWIQKIRHRPWFLPLAFGITLFSMFMRDLWYFGHFPFVGIYLFFFAYGVAKREIFLEYKVKKIDVLLWTSLLLISVSIQFFFFGYYYNTSLFYAIACIHLFFSFQPFFLKKKIFHFFATMGKNSLWVYLTHFPFLEGVLLLILSFTTAPAFVLLLVLCFSLPGSFILGLATQKLFRQLKISQ